MAWCWAVNGFFSVLGATLTTILSMALGFDRTILVGLALYVVAASVLPSREEPADELAVTRRPPTTDRRPCLIGQLARQVGEPSLAVTSRLSVSAGGCGAGR